MIKICHLCLQNSPKIQPFLTTSTETTLVQATIISPQITTKLQTGHPHSTLAPPQSFLYTAAKRAFQMKVWSCRSSTPNPPGSPIIVWTQEHWGGQWPNSGEWQPWPWQSRSQPVRGFSSVVVTFVTWPWGTAPPSKATLKRSYMTNPQPTSSSMVKNWNHFH